MGMSRQRRAMLLGLAAVLLWSTVASAFKLSLRQVTPVQLLCASAPVSALVLLLGLLLSGNGGRLREVDRRGLLRSALLGLLNPTLYYLILFAAYDRLPAQQAQPLNYTWAITLALLAVPLLGQRLAGRTLLALLVSYAGVWVIATRGRVDSLHFSDPLGVALALGSTLVWALYWIGCVRDRRDPLLALFLNFACGSVYCLLLAPFAGGLDLGWRGWLGAGYVGVFEMGLTFLLWLQALRLSDSAARVGNLIFLSPVLSLVFIHFLVGEDIHSSTLVGLGLILAGNALQQARRQGPRRQS